MQRKQKGIFKKTVEKMKSKINNSVADVKGRQY
jgi:hypothetical protein